MIAIRKDKRYAWSWLKRGAATDLSVTAVLAGHYHPAPGKRGGVGPRWSSRFKRNQASWPAIMPMLASC